MAKANRATRPAATNKPTSISIARVFMLNP
jgi:hypothetical protein